MNVTNKQTGEKLTAQYVTTSNGNKRMSVNGKVYTDKQFNKFFSIDAPSIMQSILESGVNTSYIHSRVFKIQS